MKFIEGFLSSELFPIESFLQAFLILLNKTHHPINKLKMKCVLIQILFDFYFPMSESKFNGFFPKATEQQFDITNTIQNNPRGGNSNYNLY